MKKVLWLLAGFLIFGCIAASSTRPFEGAVRYSDEIPTGDIQYHLHKYKNTLAESQFQYYKEGKWYIANGLIAEIGEWRIERLEKRICKHNYKYRSHSTMYGKKGPIYYFECSACSQDKGLFSFELTLEQITALKELGYYEEYE